MAKCKNHLVIIDPQNDFCDLPENYLPFLPGSFDTRYSPALPVAGAHADMLRLTAFIERTGDTLTEITVTLDSHQRIDISHPAFWQNAEGTAISPFTQIQADDVRRGHYLPRQPDTLPRVLSYLEALEKNGRYVHMVWPVHCEIGSWGQNIHINVRQAYNHWEETTLKNVNKIVKGTNPWTEHYSAIEAEVPEADDTSTQLNTGFLYQLEHADRILIAGEAGSHCVKSTVEHIVAHLPAGSAGKLLLLTDCMSPVAGFEKQYVDFIGAMRDHGARTAKTTEIAQHFLA